MKLNGSQIIMECLKEQGVDTVFGYPGGTILNVYDALYDEKGIRHVLSSHEQGAAHAADGYARATGKVGVCFATSGPGATNLVTGIATAYMDSIPMVAITANVGKSMLGKDSFQEVDIAGVVMPITKHSVIVKNIRDLAPTIRRAFAIAASGRKGPVLVDVTKDVTAAEYEYKYEKPKPVKPLTETITEEDLDRAADMIDKAKRPFLFVGGGCVASGAYREVRKLARMLNAPVCDSLMGKGVFDGTDRLYAGMLGMHGTKTANLCLYQCDLLIVLGARFSDRCAGSPGTFAPQAKILQFDADEAEIDKNVKVTASVIGDVKEILKRLLPRIREHSNATWNAIFEKLKTDYPLHYDMTKVTGPAVISEIYRQTKGNAVICTDVGQHQMWAAQYYNYKKPRTLITSGGLGTMGYGLGACIGAKVALPDRKVINISGDGCFRMNMNELASAVRNNVPVIEVVFNNHVLGMVRQWQNLFYNKRFSHTVLEDKTDFVKVAEAMGAKGIRVTEISELEPAIREALSCNEPVLVECVLDRDDMVFPMIPPGEANDKVFDAEDMQK